MLDNILRLPDLVQVQKEEGYVLLNKLDKCACADKIKVEFNKKGDCLAVNLIADGTQIKFLSMRWNFKITENLKIMCDAWERGYSEFEWKGISPDRNMPWYFMCASGRKTYGVGVKVRPNAMCKWRLDGSGITLICDVRSGSHGVILNGRCLNLCNIVEQEYEGISTYQASKRFCKKMCDDGIFAKEPVYGFNNWYYAYGNSSAEEIKTETEYLASITKGIKNRPYMVIDDGWEIERCGGPWIKGNGKFSDMKEVANYIKSQSCKAGIWLRLLRNKDKAITKDMRFSKEHRLLYNKETSDGVYKEDLLDPSVPKTIEYIKADIKRMISWGFTLIKHDFSTFDILGKYGKDMVEDITEEEWSFKDKYHTTAEIIINFYKAILDATEGKAIIIGCNTVSHLSAGLVHVSRIGDDTSGLYWNRTCRYGVNSLAFRLCQNGAFYSVDGDCVGVTDKISWEFNKQWLDLLASSGSPLFVSVKSTTVNAEQEKDIKNAFIINSKQKDNLEPLDWEYNSIPQKWLLNGKKVKYDWIDKSVIEPIIDKTEFC